MSNAVPRTGWDLFPTNNILCIGRRINTMQNTDKIAAIKAAGERNMARHQRIREILGEMAMSDSVRRKELMAEQKRLMSEMEYDF